MKVYTGFGYFKPDKTATIEVCLPAEVNLPGDNYEYEYVNISNTSYDALVVYVKKDTDNGADLTGTTLNHESKTIHLKNDVAVYSGANGTAQGFNYGKNIILIVHHEANPAAYNDVSKQLFDNLDNIAKTGVITINSSNTTNGPSKSGLGTVKKL